MKKLNSYYNQTFYDSQVAGSVNSAKVILGILYKIYKPNSVIDFGCGIGTWLSVAQGLGSKTLKGIDGPWVNKRDLLNKNIEFVSVDMEDNIVIQRKYDLAISVEVAEHLSLKRASGFVKDICKASDVVIFGAAIKHQGGTNHINEQYQHYWVDLFQSNGFECFDIFRRQIWYYKNVEWWYKQNTLLFINSSNSDTLIEKSVLLRMEKPIFDIVHPGNYEHKIKYLSFIYKFQYIQFIYKIKLFLLSLRKQWSIYPKKEQMP